MELSEKQSVSSNGYINYKHAYTGVPTSDHYDKEKPWKRVISEIKRKGTHLYEPVRSVPSSLLILVLGAYLVLGYLMQLVEDDLARVIPETEIAEDNASTFSEESALRYLTQILGDEPRVCGTVAHLHKSRDLKGLVDEVAASASLPVHTDWQMTTGDFWMTQSEPYVSYYHNVSNIVALLEGTSGFSGNGTGPSVLINCHYDSVPFAMGTSDDAVFCAVMLETLARLSRRQQKFKQNIIFLFNGAEENGLQGSHAFLTHPWGKGVTSVVNLDAAGMNGKATLFQVTDPRVLKIFQQVTHKPQAQAFGELMFQTGVIPSDTDFRIWMDYGSIYGVDIVFSKYGHVYHTRNDNTSLLKPGVLQYAGNMLLDVASGLADSELFEEEITPSAAVYYDYLNTFMLEYSYNVAFFVDASVVLVTLLSVMYYVWLVGFHVTTITGLVISVVGRMVSMAGGILLFIVLVSIMTATTIQLRYLSQAWVVVPIFWMPYIIGAISTSQLWDAFTSRKISVQNGLNRSIRTVQAMAASRVLMALYLLALLCVPDTAPARYVITVPLLIMCVSSAISLTVLRSFKLQGWHHLLLELSLSLPTVVFMYSLCLRFDAIILPVLGRMVTETPDLLAGGLNLVLALYVATAVSGMELLFSRKRLWLVLGGALVASVVVMLTPMAPYQGDGLSLQRHYWFHTEIKTYNFEGDVTERTSGILIIRSDVYTLERAAQQLKSADIRTDFEKDCEEKVYCNLPLFRPRYRTSLHDSLFVYTEPPAPFTPSPALHASRTCVGETCLLNFTMTGAPHNLLTFWPVADVNVTSWSFKSPLRATFTQLQRPVYVIRHSMTTYSDPAPGLNFTFTMTVPLSLQSGPIVSVSHHAHKLHHPQDFTTPYRLLIESMPDYFNIATTITVRSNYEF